MRDRGFWLGLLLLGASLAAAPGLGAAEAKQGDDFRWIRGANYVPSYARNDVQTWLDYDPAVVDRELGYAERLKLNAVRVFLNVVAYEHNPKQFLDRFESFLELCRKHKIVMQPVVFDSCFGVRPSAASYRDVDWVANPGHHRLTPEHWPKLDEYLRAVVGSHRDDRRIVLWDVMNEPTCTSEISQAKDPEAERRKVWAFIRHAVDEIKSLGARQPTTCGVMTSAELPSVIDKVDVVAWHNYTPELREDIRRVRALCEAKKKPCHLNEIVGYNSTFASAMPVVHEEKVGWFFWELMYGKTQFSRGENPIQGLIYPDGTCRDAAEVAWVLHPEGTRRDPQDVAAEAGFPQRRWTPQQAWDWYRLQPWLCGVNYIPGTAANTTEIWQAESFDEKTIDRELGWGRKLGLNWLRVNLQYLVWKHDAEGLKGRMDRFLQIADRHGLRIMFVPFDDCMFGDPPMPEPVLGKQRDPIPGMIMSSWTPSPGLKAVTDRSVWPDLERFVRDVVGRFARDERVLAWDLYNEPGNSGMGNKSLALVEAVFGWARQVRPRQPLTVGLWNPAMEDFNRRQTELSDVVTFHVYADYAGMREAIHRYKATRRPVICTEWMARQLGSRFATELPLLKREGVGWCSWGLANGRSQCQFPWWSKRGDPEPKVWFTDVLRRDGTPYDPAEIEVIRKMTAQKRLDFAGRDFRQAQPEPGTVLGTDPAVRYSAGWTLWSGDGPLSGKLHYNNASGGTAEVTLEGTSLWLVHKVGPDCGIAELLLDGKPAVKANGGALEPDPKGQAALDTFSPSVEWNRRTLVARGLRPDKHTLKILVTGRRQAASTNAYVQLVAFEAGP